MTTRDEPLFVALLLAVLLSVWLVSTGDLVSLAAVCFGWFILLPFGIWMKVRR